MNAHPVRTCYAHSVESIHNPADGWEQLERHLRCVAQGTPNLHNGAAHFAEAFGASEWGAAAAWWHDLGKYSDCFQDYLLQANGLTHPDDPNRVLPTNADHKTFGAKLASTKGPLGQLLAYIIAGHHNGMPNTEDLEKLLAKNVEAQHAPSELLERSTPAGVALQQSRKHGAFQLAFFTRMVFSALVDADFLATEAFMNATRQSDRTAVTPPPIASLATALRRQLNEITTNADSTPVNRHRTKVLNACLQIASSAPGFFSLTVPTGGGKTLSSLAFALDHARSNGLRRIIYAAPFTSIIEQNANVFREALASAGPGAVLEHHSTFESDADDVWSRLASENWDAPLIVTTNVQLYESLFHHKPARCRKLHRIARSVIVLDEAQSIPVNLLTPTLAMLKELVRNYGCTVVLCTATQPALLKREGFDIGIEHVTEIAPDPPALYKALRRVNVERAGTLTDDELAERIASEPQVLCVVQRKPQARDMFCDISERVGEASDTPLRERACLHLSTDMCPAHRSLVIELIRERLGRSLPCRVVSTSLIEAGVDVDFPVVYRAMAGLDSIAQAAGRCNREGKLGWLGRVVVFDTEGEPPNYAKASIRDARTVLGSNDDPLDPAVIERYFREHYWMKSDRWDHGARDEHGVSGLPVMGCFSVQGKDISFNFKTAAQRYRLIEDDQTPVVVPWGSTGKALIAELQSLTEHADRHLRRRLQRYSVGLYSHTYNDLRARGAVVEVGEFAPGVFILIEKDMYDPTTGLNADAGMDPGRLIS